MAIKDYDGPSLGDFGTNGNWGPYSVPGPFDDVAIYGQNNDGSLFVVFSEIADQVVNSITIGPNDELEVSNHRTLSLVNGTWQLGNLGILEVFQGSLMLGGTFLNKGSINLDGGTTSLETGNAEIDADAANTVLDGGGNVQMRIGGGPSSNLITGGANVTLTNVNNVISGDGTIGGPSSFLNEGTIETNNATSSHGGTLAIFEETIPGYTPGVFTNKGVITANSGGTIHISVSGEPGFNPGTFINESRIAVDSGGTLIFGSDGNTETIINNASIELSAIPGDGIFQIAGNTTIGTTGDANGTIDLIAQNDAIVSDGNAATLTLSGQVLEGEGTVGDANHLVLINRAVIKANLGVLTLEALNATNSGIIEAVDGGKLEINNPLDNHGVIVVAGTGSQVGVVQPVTGPGEIDIGDNGLLRVFLNGSIAGDVSFDGTNATLSEVPGAVAGTVNGATFSDAIIFQGVNATGANVVWDQTSPTAGTLSLFDAGGNQLATLNMGGQFNSSNFAVSAVSDAGTFATKVTVQFSLPPVTPLDIQNDHLGITRSPLAVDQATTEANAITAGTTTETAYVNDLLAHVGDTTIPAVAVEGSMYNAVGSSAEITNLVTQFLPAQVAVAQADGLNAQVYACETLGLAFAFGDENGGTGFNTNFGPANKSMPATHAGDVAFAAAAASAIFGSAANANTPNAILGFVTNWEAFYTAHGIPGIANATATQIDLAARGAAWGDAVGVALAGNLGPLPGQVTNFLEDAAHGTAVYSASLLSQPTAAPFEAAALAASAESQVQLTGVAAPTDHMLLGHG